MIYDYSSEDNKCYICKSESYGNILCKKCYERYKEIKDNFLNRKNPINLWYNQEHDIKDNIIKLIAFMDILETQEKCGDTTTFILDLLDALEKEDKKNKPHIKCKDGHFVRSKSEKIIDDYFFEHNIKHIYEKEIKENGITIHPDFYLPDILPNKKVVLEHFGLNWKEYKKNIKLKKEFYKQNDYYLIETTEEDIENGIEDILENKFKELNKNTIYNKNKKLWF